MTELTQIEKLKLVQKRSEDKGKKYEEAGAADKDFQKKIDGKTIHMWLPDSVFDQQKMIALASEIYHKTGNYVEDELRIVKEYSCMVLKHTKIDGQILNPELYSFADLEAYPLLYWMELLSPLFSWGQERTKKVILD